MTECDHGMNPAWCGICRAPKPEPRYLEGVTVAARFAGKCPGCGDRIEEGEDIHLTGDGVWVCSGCRDRIAR